MQPLQRNAQGTFKSTALLLVLKASRADMSRFETIIVLLFQLPLHFKERGRCIVYSNNRVFYILLFFSLFCLRVKLKCIGCSQCTSKRVRTKEKMLFLRLKVAYHSSNLESEKESWEDELVFEGSDEALKS